jgi:general secretion pathway protein F
LPTFEYSGFKIDGSPCRGRIEAGTSKQALRDLAAGNVFVEKLTPMRSDVRLDVHRRSTLYRELGALLGAGLPLDRALSMIMETEDSVMAGALAIISPKINEGSSLADSISSVCADVDGYERAALASAERTATLPLMLSRMADMLDVQDAVRDKLRTAFIYPAFVFFLGIIVAFVMLGFVVPKTELMLKASGMTMPRASVVAITATKTMAFSAGAIAAVLTLLMALARRKAARDARFAIRFDKFLLRLPLMKGAGTLAGMRFASILSVLTESGLTAVAALPLAGAGTGRPWLEDCVLEQTEKVKNGASLSTAVSALPMFGAGLSEWVRVGEAGGCLAAMLDVAAAKMQRTWDRALSRLLILLEPAMLAAVGLFVMALALALILPVIGMTRAIGAG